MEKLILRDGTSQEERLLAALKEGYFNVDELRFEDLLSMAAEYAGLLKFYNVSNLPEGDWRAFFDADEVSVLASLLSANFKRYVADAAECVRDAETVLARLRDGSAGVETLPAFGIAAQIDSWSVGLERLRSVAAVRAQEKIAGVIEKTLAEELHKMRLFLRQHGVDADAAIGKLSPVWQVIPGSRSDMATADAPRFLKANFRMFHNAALFLQDSLVDTLILSLGRANHDPAIGLFISFLKLFKKVQDKLNGFTRNHLNFYYEDVLKIRRRDFVPDSAHLLFKPDKAGREVLVRRGTEFGAGLDANNVALFYTADNDLTVSDAKVCALHTLYFNRDELSSPENALLSQSPAPGEPPGQFVTAAKLNRIDWPADDGLSPDAETMSHPLFGDPRRAKTQTLFDEARLGFAVASDVLLLKHGQRDITLTFKLAANAGAGGLIPFTTRLRNILKTSREDAFYRAFRRMFKVAFTGEAGWLEVAEYLPQCHVVGKYGCIENGFKIQVRLSDNAGAIIPYSPKIHGDNFDTDFPVVKLTVNPDAYFYPHTLLSEMIVREIEIEVEVKGCTDILAYNRSGPLNTNAQFNPFGPLPAPDDYLVIGNYEAARKKLTDFNLDVEWGGLPHDMDGFAGYYRAYGFSPEQCVFKAGLSVLRDRSWLPEESKQPEVDLFAHGASLNEAAESGIAKKQRFSFRGVCSFIRPLAQLAQEQYGYDSSAKDGFFKLGLSYPPHAFGHKDYPRILSKVMMENATLQKSGLAKIFSRALPPQPLPNPPYTPLINSISISYKAVDTISLERIASSDDERRAGKIFHLHPLGVEKLSPQAYGKISLTPCYEASGNLFIALSATRLAGMLTLFFHLREDSLPEACTGHFDFGWHYLAGNQWKAFSKSQVISDTTNGFLTSGIVTLDVPDDIDLTHSVLPDGYYWIRVSARSDAIHTLCSLYGVYTNALKTTWMRQEGNSLAHLDESLPAGSIKEARLSLTGIAEIRQIMNSFGGMPPENDTQRTIRVSERLRHKNRAVTPWDYERLVLQQFPEIFKVKCFPCMTDAASPEDRIQPGHLLIVLIPYLKDSASVNFRPMVNAALLVKVREFLRELASANVKIRVRNPAYEQVQVRCKVTFKPGMAHGFYLNELNREIVRYLSPWSEEGFVARFDWRIRCNDVQSHIQALDYVETVSALSLRQIVEDDDRKHHHLSDTHRAGVGEIGPASPWSIAIPAKRHLIEVADKYANVETGISNLAIGTTFILSR